MVGILYFKAGGDPAAACKTGKERVRTTGPPVALCRLTTHDDTTGQVSFVCSNNSLVVVGSGGRCLWVPSMQGIQQAIQTSLKPLRHSPAINFSRGSLLGLRHPIRQNQLRERNRKLVRPNHSGVRGRCVDGSSQVPPVVHAGYAAKRMCLREFSQAIDNTQPGKFPPGKGPVRRWSAGTGKCVAICDSLQNARLGKTW
jgi:hypothetical protein